MGAGRFVGRVGRLAIALGVGVAIASGQSVAWAEDGSSPDPDAAASTPAAPDKDPTASTGTSTPDTSDTAAEPSEATDSDDPESTDTPGRSSTRRTSTKPDRHTSDVDDATTASDSGSGDDDGSVDTDASEPESDSSARTAGAHRRQQLDDSEDEGAVVVASAAVAGAGAGAEPTRSSDVVVAQQLSTAVAETSESEPTVGDVVVTALAAATLAPLTSDDPAAPVGSLVELALLAVGTRLRTSGDPAVGEPSGSLVAVTLSNENNIEAITFDVAPLAAPNSAPTVPTQPNGVPNPVTGVVAGTITATDADNDPLTYAVVTGPATGTVELNPATGAYTYTPTQAARLAAGVTAGLDTDSFTVAVSDGQQTTNAAVSVYVSPLQYSTSASLTTGPAPSAVTVTTDGRMFVANTANWTVSVIDTATGKQIDAQPNNWFSNDIQVGPWPGALLLSPDGKKLYIANTGWLTVSVIDTTTYKAIDADPGNWFSNDITVGSNPSAMTLGADGRLYVANRGGASVSVIDTNTFKRIDTDPANWFSNDIAVGYSPSALALSGSQLYVANRDSNTVSVIDTATYRVTKTVIVGKQPSAMALGSNGRLYVVNTGANTVSMIDTTTNTVVANSISVGTAPTSIALDPVSKRAFVTNGNDTVSVIDTVTNSLLGMGVIDTDTTGGHAVTVGPNGSVYVADTADNAVRVLALARGNTAPIVGTPVVGTPDPSAGAVTLTIAVTDPDGDPLSWGWSQPSTGTFSNGDWTDAGRTFIFTPSQAARDAAASGGPTSTKITIDVGDNRTTIPVQLTVPILATVGPTTATAIGAVTLPGSVLQPRKLTLSPDGTRAVVVTDSPYTVLTGATAQVTVINTNTGKQVGTTATLAGRSGDSAPEYSPDGGNVVITTNVTDSNGTVTVKLTTINLNTGAATAGAGAQLVGSSSAAGTSSTLSLATSTTGGLVQAAVYDTATGQQVGTTLALPGDGSVRVSRDGSRAVLQAVQTDAETGSMTTRFASLDASAGTQIGTTMVRSGSWSIPTYMGLLGDDGGRAVIISAVNPQSESATTQVAVIDTSGTQIGGTVSLAGNEFGSIQAAADDSRALMITNVFNDPRGTFGYDTRLTVIDTTTGARIGSTTSLNGFMAGGVTFNAETNRAVVTTMDNIIVGSNLVGTTEVAIINTTTGQQMGTTLTLVDDYRSGSLVSADGSVVVVTTGTQLAVLSTASGRQLGTTLVRAAIGAKVVSGDGTHVVFLTGPSSIFGWEPMRAEVLRIS